MTMNHTKKQLVAQVKHLKEIAADLEDGIGKLIFKAEDDKAEHDIEIEKLKKVNEKLMAEIIRLKKENEMKSHSVAYHNNNTKNIVTHSLGVIDGLKDENEKLKEENKKLKAIAELAGCCVGAG